jgi:hypothetical protein
VAETLKGAAESLPVVTETFPADAEGLTAVAETSAAEAENKTVAENRGSGGKWSEWRKMDESLNGDLGDYSLNGRYVIGLLLNYCILRGSQSKTKS